MTESRPKYDIESLEGKAVLVTGGTTGIGRTTGQMLLDQGCKILIFGRHQKELGEALEQMRGEVYGLAADVADPGDIKRVFSQVDSKLGGLDILINNAALSADSVVSTTYDDILYIVKTNLVGYLACCYEAITRMKEKGQGDIVNVGSMSAVERDGSDIYTATKSGVDGFTYALRPKIARDNIRVILVEPGLVGTDMTADRYPPEKQVAMEKKREMLVTEDIAECIRFALVQPRRCDIIHIRAQPHIVE